MKAIKKNLVAKRLITYLRELNTFSKLLELGTKSKKYCSYKALDLFSLEDRIVPAFPFSPAYPHISSIVTGNAPVSNTASFTVTFNQPVIGVDAADFEISSTGTIIGGIISSVAGSGSVYTVTVTGISGYGNLGLNMVDLPSLSAITSFSNQQTIGVGTAPRALTQGDVNGDGFSDLITANFTSDNLSVNLGNGNGTFQAQKTIAVGDGPQSVMLGDVNNDGKADILVANHNSFNVGVLLGNGNGTFQNQQVFATGNYPSSISLGDVNNDGKLDIITSNYGSDNISILLGNGNGTFTTQQQFAVSDDPVCVSVGDVNCDGKLDIVASNSVSNNVSVLLGNGNGTFQINRVYAAEPGLYGVTIGDVNNDGKPDIVTSNTSSNNASVLLGKGDGTFQTKKTFDVGKRPFAVKLGDINGDGKIDIATANTGSSDTSVLLGNGDGTFQVQTKYGAGNQPIGLVLNDLNNDGRLDIATPNFGSDNVSVILGNGGSAITAPFKTKASFTTGLNPRAVPLADLNGDGLLDIVSANESSDSASVLLGNGDGTFQAQQTYATGDGLQSLALGDINGDGKTDIVTANYNSFDVSVLLGNGNGTFQAQQKYATGNYPTSVALGDVNRDGKVDILTSNFGSDNVSILLGNGNGTFQSRRLFATSKGPVYGALGDVNSDGKIDIICANWYTNDAGVLLGNGDGTFQAQKTYAVGVNPSCVSLGDVNGDGKIDIVSSNEHTNSVSILAGNGNGTFQVQQTFATGSSPFTVALGDINGDGKIDIITPNMDSNNASILIGNGNGTFQTQMLLSTGNRPSSVSLGDVNCDGRSDIITANFGSNDAGVLLNSLRFAGKTATVLEKTTTTISSSTNPSIFGQTITFTAKVTGTSATPTGQVTFRKGDATIGTVALVNGYGSLDISNLGIGNDHLIAAEYSGDSNYFGSVSSTLNQTVNLAPSIISANSATFTTSKSGSFIVEASGFPAPTFSISMGTLPNGVTLSATGLVSGIPGPGTGGAYAITIKASNGVGTDATQAFTLTVNQAPSITSTDKATFTTGQSGTFTALATGFPNPTFSITAGTLPSGVTLSAAGILSGKPADGTGGTYPITIKASNGVGTDATQAFTLTVNQAPSITSTDKATFKVGSISSFNSIASGFPSPIFSINSGKLPDGITLSTSGVLSGTPSTGAGGIYKFTINAGNGVGTEASQIFTLTVNESPSILGSNSRSFRTGTSNTYQFAALGFPAPLFSLRGNPPAGITLGTDGLLSGNPNASTQGVYSFTVVANNGLSPEATKDFVLTITDGPVITSPDSSIFRIGQQKSFQATATGTPVPSFTLAGALPQGLAFTSTGILSGTPAAGTSGTYSLSITAGNGVLPNDTQAFTLVVQEVPSITSANQVTLTTGTTGNFQMTATGYPAPVFSLVSGSLPGGVSLSAGGLMSGAPATGNGGTYFLTVKASNGVGTDAIQSFTLIVNQAPDFTGTNSVTMTTGIASSFNLTATGYPSPTFSLTSGSLPAGISLSAVGRISGTPSATAGGSYIVTFKASNGVAPSATKSFTLTINQAPAITSSDSAIFSVGQKGTFSLIATGFPSPSFSIAAGSLPDGITLSSEGILSGTPAAGTGGIYRFAIQAANGVGGGATQAFTLTINQGLEITSANQTTFATGVAENFTVTATGNPSPTFIIKSGVLPAGVTLNSSGSLSGTPQSGTGGTYPLVIRASNSIGGEVTQAFTLVVNQAPVITTTNNAGFIVGKSRIQALAATGYPAPAFSIGAGSLPNGIGLTVDGKLQGVALPGSMGSYTVQVKATNAGGIALQNFTVAVNQEGVYSVAAMGGGGQFSKLVIYKNGSRELLREVVPFPGFRGEFYTDHGDVTGDGIEDIVVGSGKGSQNGHVVVFDGAVLLNPNQGKAVELPYGMGGSVRASLYAFVGYSSGVAVRLADLNDDGVDDIVMAPGTGAGTKTHSHIRVWNGKDSMADFEAGKPLPYDYRWEMASFWAFGEGNNPGGGLSMSVIRQPGPDLVIASQLFKGGSKVFRYDGQKVLTTVTDLTGWPDLSLSGNTVVGYDREGNRFFANGGTDNTNPDTVFVRDKDKKAAYRIDRVFGDTPSGLRLGLANVDTDAEDELLVTRGNDATTKVYDLFADKALLIETLKPGGNSGWV